MYCDSCGAQLTLDQRFCPNCGKPVNGSVMGSAPRDKISRHVRLLGILWIVISALRLIPAIGILAIFQGNRDFLPPDLPSFIPPLVSLFGLIFLAGGLLGLAIGWGLLTWQPWARVGAIVLGCISLVEMPLGTALGIYTLWALLPEPARQDYQARSMQSSGV